MRIRSLATLMVGASLLTPVDVCAQDWDSVYRRSRTAHAISYVAPAAGLGLGVPMIHAGLDRDDIPGLGLALAGTLMVGAGVTAGAPMHSWSSTRAGRALREQGVEVPRLAGDLSWIGTGVTVAALTTHVLLLPVDPEGHRLAFTRWAVIGGALLAYGAGAAQWLANGRGWQGRGAPAQVSARF